MIIKKAKAEAIRIARELSYPKEVIERIKRSTRETEIQLALTSARKKAIAENN